MFEFYSECTFSGKDTNWPVVTLQIITALIALFALIVAFVSLRGLRRTQSIQTHMNLIALENDIRKNHANLKLAYRKYSEATSADTKGKLDENKIEELAIQKDNAFELYISSADKLASLINTEYLQNQFSNRNWEEEYREIFEKVRDYYEKNTSIIPGKSSMIKNLNEVLSIWNSNK